MESMQGGSGFLNEYLYVGGQRVARVANLGPIYYYYGDHLGTARLITDGGGTKCYDADYFPWGGEQHVYTNSCAQNYKFTGKERDPDTGSDYFGARWYRNTMARFYSPDWSATPTAVPYADFTDPQTLNLYSYVRNNPLAKIDADGHCYPLCTVAIGTAVGAGAGALAEVIAEKLKGEPLNGSKILHAAEGGALAGAVTGFAGPEAGFLVKAGLSAGGQIIGGGTERALNGEKIADVKQVAKDAVAGALGAKIENIAEKTFSSTFVKKAVPAVVETQLDTLQRSLPDKPPRGTTILKSDSAGKTTLQIPVPAN
jgi:RHS repeat-associated protein